MGITAASLVGHLLKLEISTGTTHDGSTATITLTDVDNTVSYTHTFTTGLPTQDVALFCVLGVGTAATNLAIKAVVNRMAYSGGA